MFSRSVKRAAAALGMAVRAHPFAGAALVATTFGVAQLAPLSTPAAAALSGETYNFAQVRSNQFVETWTSVRGNTLHIRVHVANQRGGLASTSFAPIVTLAFHDAQGKRGELKLGFNVPAVKKNEWHEIDVPTGLALWQQSDKIVASAAENNVARPTPGSFQITVQAGGILPVVARPEQ